MFVNIFRSGAVLGICAVALAGCGSQTVSENSPAGAGDPTAVCKPLVDGDTYTAVESAKAATGSSVKDWLRTREQGTYVEAKVDAIADAASVTVCQMSAPGLQYPHPGPLSGSGETTGPAEPTSAIVIVGAAAQPDVDSIGPNSRVTQLMTKLK